MNNSSHHTQLFCTLDASVLCRCYKFNLVFINLVQMQKTGQAQKG